MVEKLNLKAKLPIIEVIWRDAYGEADWHIWDDEEHCVIVNTVGYFIGEDNNYIYLASTAADSHKVANTMNIPKGCVISSRLFRGKIK